MNEDKENLNQRPFKNAGLPRRCNAGLLRRNEFLTSNQTNDLILQGLEEMKREIGTLKTTVVEQNKEIMKLVAENAAILKEFAKKEVDISRQGLMKFPINHKDELDKIEEDCNEERDEIINLLRRIIGKAGIKKNLNRIFGQEIILNFNFDGTKGKEPLKNYENFMDILFEAIKTEGLSKDAFRQELRTALKLHKNRHYRNICNQKRKSQQLTKEQETAKPASSN